MQSGRHTHSTHQTYTLTWHTHTTRQTHTCNLADIHMQLIRHAHSTHQTYTLNSPDIHTQFSRHTNSTHTQLTRHINIIWQTRTLNSPDTHAQLTRQACTVTQGQPWTSCCPCSSVEIDTLSGSRASCWGRTVSGSHTAGTSPTGTGAAQGGQQNSQIRQGGEQNSQIRQGGKQNSTIKQGGAALAEENNKSDHTELYSSSSVFFPPSSLTFQPSCNLLWLTGLNAPTH